MHRNKEFCTPLLTKSKKKKTTYNFTYNFQCTSLHITFLFILNALICPLTVLVIGSFIMYMNVRVFNNILQLIESYLASQMSIPKQTRTMLILPRQQSLWVHIWHLVTTTTQTYAHINTTTDIQHSLFTVITFMISLCKYHGHNFEIFYLH